MKRSLLVVTAAVALMATPAAYASSYEPEESDNPIRLLSYPVHFVGKVAEYAIARPITWLASQPATKNWFGRTSNARTNDYSGDKDYYQLHR
jgi:hypothetical protein